MSFSNTENKQSPKKLVFFHEDGASGQWKVMEVVVAASDVRTKRKGLEGIWCGRFILNNIIKYY